VSALTRQQQSSSSAGKKCDFNETDSLDRRSARTPKPQLLLPAPGEVRTRADMRRTIRISNVAIFLTALGLATVASAQRTKPNASADAQGSLREVWRRTDQLVDSLVKKVSPSVVQVVVSSYGPLEESPGRTGQRVGQQQHGVCQYRRCHQFRPDRGAILHGSPGLWPSAARSRGTACEAGGQVG